MNKKHPKTKDTVPSWHRLALALLVASFFLLPGSSCGSDNGVTEPPTIPGTEVTCPTEQTIPTETILPTVSVTEPTLEPTEEPTSEPTLEPTSEPTTEPTQEPTEEPTSEPTSEPTTEPTQDPTVEQTIEPTEPPTTAPTEETTAPTEPSVPETLPPLQIQLTPDKTEVLLIHQRAWGFARRDLSKPVDPDIYSYKLINERLDYGVPVTLSVNITELPQGVEVVSITITFADNAAFDKARVFHLSGEERSVSIPFLMAGKEYHYRALITFSDGTTKNLQTSFKTAATPRLLSIDGVVNVRDIGGWITNDGHVIRQGLLYRGSELDGAVKPNYRLTAEGIRQMREELDIRSDLDLRYSGEVGGSASVLGTDVLYKVYGAPAYWETFEAYGRDTVRQIFVDLAERSNYPVYLHCTYGLDRTGTICYLLEALLGVSEENLQREFELSALHHTWVDSQGLQILIDGLNTRQGDNIQEKTEAFLLECGVTPQQIATIRDIFLEKA